MSQTVMNLPAMQKTWVQTLGREDPLEKGMATHCSTLAWRIPKTEEPGGLQSMESQRVGHNWETYLKYCFQQIKTSNRSPSAWGLFMSFFHVAFIQSTIQEAVVKQLLYTKSVLLEIKTDLRLASGGTSIIHQKSIHHSPHFITRPTCPYSLSIQPNVLSWA